MKRTNRIFNAHVAMLFWQREYRGALSGLKMANRWKAGKSYAMAWYNVCKSAYLNAMLALRIAYTYPKERV
tara:strand:+ start:1590 stop:1802 length:213 start_codon:yes stop_codon:yes gene_type:complete